MLLSFLLLFFLLAHCYFLSCFFFPLAHCYFLSCYFIHTATQKNCYFLSCYFFSYLPTVTFFPVTFFPTCQLLLSFLLLFFLLLFFLPETVTFFPVTFFPVTFFPCTKVTMITSSGCPCLFIPPLPGLGGETKTAPTPTPASFKTVSRHQVPRNKNTLARTVAPEEIQNNNSYWKIGS